RCKMRQVCALEADRERMAVGEDFAIHRIDGSTRWRNGASALRFRSMSKPKVTYFDAPVSRGEEVRLAFHLAGVEFEDNRIKRDGWPALKPTTPFGSLPLLELPGKPVL